MFGKKKAQQEEREIPNLSWEADIVLNERMSRVIAWRVASAAIIMALLMGVALIMLVPLKQVVPYVVTVDKLSGETHVATSTKNFVGTSELNDKHWVKSFLIARERYNYKLLQHDYDTVKLMAGDKPWLHYTKLFEGENGLDKKLVDKVEIIPAILSITLGDGGLATVRYELKTKDYGSVAEPSVVRRIATLRYSYKPQQIKKEFDLIDNPLGFTVDAYQTDPEFLSTNTEQGAKK